jgi:hypothetical protein
VFIFAALVIGTLPACARLVPDWPYEKLWDESDVVVVIEPLKTEKNDDKLVIPWDPQQVWQGLTTHFKIHGCLKGGPLADEIVVKHFDYKAEVLLKATVISDGPCFIRFKSGPLSYDEIISKDGKVISRLPLQNQTPMFLAFLKKVAEKTFMPVTGQIDPCFSFRDLREVFFSPFQN